MSMKTLMIKMMMTRVAMRRMRIVGQRTRMKAVESVVLVDPSMRSRAAGMRSSSRLNHSAQHRKVRQAVR